MFNPKLRVCIDARMVLPSQTKSRFGFDLVSFAPPARMPGKNHALLTLHADDLAQRMDDLDEIGLRRHDRVDVLVGGRRFVNHAFAFAAFNMRRGPCVGAPTLPASGGLLPLKLPRGMLRSGRRPCVDGRSRLL